MRSRKVDLEDVVEAFESWRADREHRRIPEDLWKVAVGLLDRYAPSTICRHLRLNLDRFRAVQRELGATPRRGGGRRRSTAGRRAGAVAQRVVSQSSSITPVNATGFMELTPSLRSVAEAAAGSHCRLTLENGTGTLSVVSSASDALLLEAVCRVAIGMLGTR